MRLRSDQTIHWRSEFTSLTSYAKVDTCHCPFKVLLICGPEMSRIRKLTACKRGHSLLDSPTMEFTCLLSDVYCQQVHVERPRGHWGRRGRRRQSHRVLGQQDSGRGRQDFLHQELQGTFSQSCSANRLFLTP